MGNGFVFNRFWVLRFWTVCRWTLPLTGVIILEACLEVVVFELIMLRSGWGRFGGLSWFLNSSYNKVASELPGFRVCVRVLPSIFLWKFSLTMLPLTLSFKEVLILQDSNDYFKSNPVLQFFSSHTDAPSQSSSVSIWLKFILPSHSPRSCKKPCSNGSSELSILTRASVYIWS